MELKYIFLDEDAIPLKVVIITAKYKTDFNLHVQFENFRNFFSCGALTQNS